MKIRRRHIGAAVVLALEGRLDAEAAPELGEAISEDVDGGARCIVIDCAGLEFLNTRGLQVLLIGAHRLHLEGGRLAVAALRGPARVAYDIARFPDLIATLESVEEAVEKMC